MREQELNIFRAIVTLSEVRICVPPHIISVLDANPIYAKKLIKCKVKLTRRNILN